MSEKALSEMTYPEFSSWAAKYVADGLMKNGFQGLSSSVDMVIQQQMILYKQNGGFAKEKKQ